MLRFASIILLLLFTLSFLFVNDNSFDQDLGRHLKLGEIITSSGQVPKTNLFSYTNPDFPFINTHYLFEVFVYNFSKVFGLEPLLWIKFLILALSVSITLFLARQRKSALFLPLGFIFLHVLRERIELRPEIFSFLFTALTLLILEKYLKKGSRWIFALPLIELVWINTHIYFFVGLVLQAIFLLYIGYQHLRFHPWGGKLKVLLFISGLSVALSLINPNGLNGLLYPLEVTKNYGYTIVENQTIFFLENIHFKDPNFLFVKLCLGLGLLITLFGFLIKKIILKDLLLIILGSSLTLLNVRSMPYLFFIAFPAFFTTLSVFKNSRFTLILSLIAALLLIYESLFYITGNYYQRTDSGKTPQLIFEAKGERALDFLLKKDLPQPIYNNFDIGSYIIYRAYPKYSVFVDGRPEAYPTDFFQKIYIPTQFDYQQFKVLDGKKNFQTVIFSHTDQTDWAKNFLKGIAKDSKWQPIYLDDFIVIFIKADTNFDRKIPVLDLANLTPQNYNFSSGLLYLKIASFLINSDNVNAAYKFITKALEISPQSPAVNAYMAAFGNRPNFLDSNIWW